MRAYSLLAAGAIVALLGVTGWALFFRQGGSDQFGPCHTTLVQGGLDRIGGPFELVDSLGQTVTDTDIITMPTILYFGFTFCPDVCPLDSARNALATDLLEQAGYIVQPVFISVDPARDTPEVVGEFAHIFHERMIGLTGSDAQVRAAALAYRAFFARHEDQGEYYPVDHSTFSYLVLPGYGTVEILRHDLSAEQVAESAQCFLERA